MQVTPELVAAVKGAIRERAGAGVVTEFLRRPLVAPGHSP